MIFNNNKTIIVNVDISKKRDELTMDAIEFQDYKSKISEYNPKIKKLGDSLNIELLKKQVAELENKAAAPNFWDNMNEAQNIMKKCNHLKDKINKFKNLKILIEDSEILLEMLKEDDDKELSLELNKTLEKINYEIKNQTLSTLLIGEYDSNNAIITLHAGAGGTEAMDWVEMLFRMYSRWAERHGFKVKTLDYTAGEEAGIKSISLLIEGLNAYGYLKVESGVHRLVRVSPFDSSGRRHTSFASNEVLPEIDESMEVEIREEDIKMDVFRSSGAGGQHVNKTSSAVRLTHIPTGIVTSCQNERSQLQNKTIALKMLKSKLIEIKEREHLEKIEDIKGDQKEIAWGSQIRSYIFMPYTLVKDHRTNYECGNISAVMDGDIDNFINVSLTKQSPQNL